LAGIKTKFVVSHHTVFSIIIFEL